MVHCEGVGRLVVDGGERGGQRGRGELVVVGVRVVGGGGDGNVGVGAGVGGACNGGRVGSFVLGYFEVVWKVGRRCVLC